MAIGTTTFRTKRPEHEQHEEQHEHAQHAQQAGIGARLYAGCRRRLAGVFADVGTLMFFGGDAGAVALRLCSECELRPEACICDEDARNRAHVVTRIAREG
jgi:hypothetical protein